jgi:hypothetical protein
MLPSYERSTVNGFDDVANHQLLPPGAVLVHPGRAQSGGTMRPSSPATRLPALQSSVCRYWIGGDGTLRESEARQEPQCGDGHHSGGEQQPCLA